MPQVNESALSRRLPSHRRMLAVHDILLAQLTQKHHQGDVAYDTHLAGSDGFQFDVHVDWDGGDDNVGTFSVVDPDGSALEVGNLLPQSSVNDIIVPAHDLRGSSLRIRMTRPRRDCGFSVWAIPVTWLRNPGTAAGTAAGSACDEAVSVPHTLDRNDLSPNDVAIRGQDYTYSEGGQVITAESATDGDSGEAQVLVLDLPLGSDYEISVKLAHPTEPGKYCIQDPVGGDGSGNDDGSPPRGQ